MSWLRYCDEGLAAGKQFDLQGVVVHSGSCAYGHYYCYLQEPSGGWLELNDEVPAHASAQPSWPTPLEQASSVLLVLVGTWVVF